jgi:antitoxin VapB
VPLSIKDPNADRLARALAKRTGETLTEAVINARRERLERELRKEQSIECLVEDVMEIGRHCASLPLLDRSARRNTWLSFRLVFRDDYRTSALV